MALITSVTSAEAADIAIAPAIALGEEYNDNIFLSYPTDAKKDFITHINPSIYAAYNAPIWDWKITYSFDHRSFAKYSYADVTPWTLSLQSTVRIVRDMLFLAVRDNADRVSITAIKDFTQESPVVNQTQYNTFEVNPYAVLLLTSRTTLTTGFEYRNVWYQDPAAIDRNVYSVYGDLSRRHTERTSFTVSARSDRTKTAQIAYTMTNFLIGPRYEYQDASFLWGRIGTNTADIEANRETNAVWDAGIYHRMPTITLTFETGRAWIDDPRAIVRREDRYIAGMRIDRERTSGGVSLAVRNYGIGPYVYDHKYSTTADFSHFLTEKLQGKYTLTVDRYDSYPVDAPDTMTIVYNTDIRFDHYSTESLTLSLSYRYTDSYSPNLPENNYKINRVLAEVRKSF